MTRNEAIALATQLGHTVTTVAAFEKLIEKLGFSIGLETPSGDWVILNSSSDVVARVA